MISNFTEMYCCKNNEFKYLIRRWLLLLLSKQRFHENIHTYISNNQNSLNESTYLKTFCTRSSISTLNKIFCFFFSYRSQQTDSRGCEDCTLKSGTIQTMESQVQKLQSENSHYEQRLSEVTKVAAEAKASDRWETCLKTININTSSFWHDLRRKENVAENKKKICHSFTFIDTVVSLKIEKKIENS